MDERMEEASDEEAQTVSEQSDDAHSEGSDGVVDEVENIAVSPLSPPVLEIQSEDSQQELPNQENIQNTPKSVKNDECRASLTSKLVSPKSGLDEDGQTCTICFEPWTNSSEHRLVSLRCGHLFGRSCITRWLKGQNARCPQCNARARKSEIRNIYAKAVKVMDSSERDKALHDLMKESELRRKAEMNAAQERLKHMMAVQECERLKKELMETKRMLQEYRSSMAFSKLQSSQNNSSAFSLEKNIEIAKLGGCRIVDICELLGIILVSQPSTNELFPGFGFRKLSTMDMKPSEFVWVHQKPIRDMAFHVHDGLVLTGSLDKSVRITNILTNTVVQTYVVDSDVWSCAWDADDPVYFFAGLKSGGVYLFDIRVTSRYVHELPRCGTSTPVVALQYLRKATSATHNKCGPVVGKLSDGGFYEKVSGEGVGEYKVAPLPCIGPFTSLSSENTSGHFLLSCRPSPKQPRVTHTLCELTCDQSGDVSCNPVQTILGGTNQVQLSRSKLLCHPDKISSLLICAGDEDAQGALIWDGSCGDRLDHLRTESPVLDISGLKLNHKTFLTALTDKNLRLYSWNGC
ncbi:E3 ubiquitin-protein ligase RFWD3-like isoform X2 [Stegodyphus dumicola]|uniref:E3 ubiquitin-protein ligase RFWD3-like isoform X2 n=1 Tax=Stegodyphus dumicola TaxID=202533 RepID=UPI0015AA62D8|nr:E3 ubiquitin-protein ligase RFWD3-like isoform X2 [Stegodyphus dumicola]